MAVLQMQRISICGLREQRKSVLELLQREGMIEVSEVIPEDSVFFKTDVSATETMFEKSASEAESALEILNTYSEEKKSLLSSFAGREVIEPEIYDKFKEKYQEVRGEIIKILELERK
jgi:V/A-type H+-transporting ATPase subunit I